MTAGGTVLDTALMQTRERVAVPDMLNGQCILLQLMHQGSNGREEVREKRLHDVNATQFALIALI